jgi:hypothetical protein
VRAAARGHGEGVLAPEADRHERAGIRQAAQQLRQVRVADVVEPHAGGIAASHQAVVAAVHFPLGKYRSTDRQRRVGHVEQVHGEHGAGGVRVLERREVPRHELAHRRPELGTVQPAEPHRMGRISHVEEPSRPATGDQEPAVGELRQAGRDDVDRVSEARLVGVRDIDRHQAGRVRLPEGDLHRALADHIAQQGQRGALDRGRRRHVGGGAPIDVQVINGPDEDCAGADRQVPTVVRERPAHSRMCRVTQSESPHLAVAASGQQEIA